MPNRSRFASRLTLWLFAAALALKSAVPMLAAAAAGLQGKAVAEICDVYGVATLPPLPMRTSPTLAATAGVVVDTRVHEAGSEHQHLHGHAPGHVHVSAPEPSPASVDAPTLSHHDAPPPGHRHGGAAGDHCALTGMVAIGVGDDQMLAGAVVGEARGIVVARAEDVVFDAVARWAALLEHGPPTLS